MKNSILILAIVLLLVSCQKQEYSPKYFDFENAWQRFQLVGKVKELKAYELKETRKGQRKVINQSITYTDKGHIKSLTQYNANADIVSTINNDFNEKGLMERQIIENKLEGKTSEAINSYNSNDKLSETIIKTDKEQKLTFEYNAQGDILKRTELGRDTTIRSYKYKYDSENRIIKRELHITPSEIVLKSTIKYNDKGNRVETISDSFFGGQHKWEYQYDNNNRLIVASEYKENKKEKQTEFDKAFNPVKVQYFRNGKEARTVKYNYKFDRTGNWIKRETWVSDNGDKSGEFVQSKTEVRDIKYF
ncbi:YnfC family lipoprotein [Prolixibacteraceae bacterium JC049]|nr:YnfC family lipoprotein [Prolixibacteraceae bacterium JC049]